MFHEESDNTIHKNKRHTLMTEDLHVDTTRTSAALYLQGVLEPTQSFLKLENDDILIICSGRPFQVETTLLMP